MKKFLISAAVLVMSLSTAFTVSAWHLEVPEEVETEVSKYFETASEFPAYTQVTANIVGDGNYKNEEVDATEPWVYYAYDPAVNDKYYRANANGDPYVDNRLPVYEGVKYGDINSDNEISTADISLLLQAWKTNDFSENMDVFKEYNKTINILDITTLLKYVFDEEVFLPQKSPGHSVQYIPGVPVPAE